MGDAETDDEADGDAMSDDDRVGGGAVTPPRRINATSQADFRAGLAKFMKSATASSSSSSSSSKDKATTSSSNGNSSSKPPPGSMAAAAAAVNARAGLGAGGGGGSMAAAAAKANAFASSSNGANGLGSGVCAWNGTRAIYDLLVDNTCTCIGYVYGVEHERYMVNQLIAHGSCTVCVFGVEHERYGLLVDKTSLRRQGRDSKRTLIVNKDPRAMKGCR